MARKGSLIQFRRPFRVNRHAIGRHATGTYDAGYWRRWVLEPTWWLLFSLGVTGLVMPDCHRGVTSGVSFVHAARYDPGKKVSSDKQSEDDDWQHREHAACSELTPLDALLGDQTT